jgi:hypothetical protein
MARKAKYDWGKSRGKYQKFETRLAMKWTEADNASSPYSDSVYIDIAQNLSVINRKLVRQGQVFRVKGMKVYTNDTSPTAFVKIGALPRTWPVFNAYKKARGLWNAHNLDALRDLGTGNLPAYYDFKVFMDVNHVTNHLVGGSPGGDENLLPVDFEDNAASTGEWVYSKFHDSGSTSNEHYLHMLGGHMSDVSTESSDDTIDPYSVGAVLAYQQSRGYPHDNQTVAGLAGQGSDILKLGPWGHLRGDDDQAKDTIVDLVADNDDAPYSPTLYPGSRQNMSAPTTVFYGRMSQQAVTSSNSGVVPAFEAPLGLVRVEVDAESDLAEIGPIHIMFDTEIMGAC